MKRRTIFKSMAALAMGQFPEAIHAASLPIGTWKPLASYRPPIAVQQKVKQQGADWKVQAIELAASYLNLDYYSLKVTQKPMVGGAPMNDADVFSKFKAHILDPNRGSANRVSFEKVGPNDSLNAAGALLYLKFKPFSFVSCRTLSYCADIPWINDTTVCNQLDAITTAAQQNLNFAEAFIAVGFSSPKEVRVSALSAGTPIVSPLNTFAFQGAGPHPIAGNRGFGYTSTPTGQIIYTIGADRVRNVAPVIDDLAALVGYCAAEVFWRELLNEFATIIQNDGGHAEIRGPERQRHEWNSATQAQVWDPTGQPAWL